MKTLRLPPIIIPRILSPTQEELEKQVTEAGQNDAKEQFKKAQSELQDPIAVVIRVVSESPDSILARGQAKSSNANLAYKYFFGYSKEMMRIIAIQLAKME